MVQLNRALAIGKLEGAEKALQAATTIPHIEDCLSQHHLFAAAFAEWHLELRNFIEATRYLTLAINLTPSEAEKRLLNRKRVGIATAND